MHDIKLFNLQGTLYEYNDNSTIEAVGSTDLLTFKSDRTECIANKVIKFLVTPIGSCAFDKNYGSKYLEYHNVNLVTHKHLLYSAITSDIVRCSTYMTNSELSIDNTIEKFSKLHLEGIDLDFDRIIGNFAVVRVKVTTTFNNTASLKVAGK